MEDSEKKKILGILGPTGVGKTDAAIELCRKLKGEIVSCDSRQIYQRLDIGTAKPTSAEQSAAKHHLINVAEIGESFSAHRYREIALEVIEGIFSRGRQPLVVGGTGLYYRALSEGFFGVPENDGQLRRNLEQEAEEYGNEALWARLNKVDPESAGKIAKSDRFRIIRALEIFEISGLPKSALARNGAYPQTKYRFITIGLNLPRKELYERINKRVESMLENGWLEETEKLISSGRLNSGNNSKLMGYNYLYKYIQGDMAFSECLERIKQAHRNYAKRQLTWFKRVRGIRWISAADPSKIDKIVELFNHQ